MERDIQKLCFHGLLVWGALYVYLVYAAALAEQNKMAALWAVATAGVTYLDYMLMLAFPEAKRVQLVAFGASISAGLVAGLLLLR